MEYLFPAVCGGLTDFYPAPSDNEDRLTRFSLQKKNSVFGVAPLSQQTRYLLQFLVGQVLKKRYFFQPVNSF
jgi:hypothetical protein